MDNPVGCIFGNELKVLLEKELNLNLQEIIKKFAPLDPVDTFEKFHKLVLSIEEFINILNELDNEVEQEFIYLTELTPYMQFELQKIFNIINKYFGSDIANRYRDIINMTSNIKIAFEITGYNNFVGNNNLNTIGNVIHFYQSRRRYFTTLLYLIPKISNGTQKILKDELILEILPIIELNCISATSISNYLILQKLDKNFKMISDGYKIYGNNEFQSLDDFFLEPERISIVDQLTHRAEQIELPKLFSLNNKIFSINELKNSILLIEASYKFYKIEDTDFNVLKNLIFKLLDYSYDDYFISISISDFNELIKGYSVNDKKLINSFFFLKSNDYFINLNSYHPFIEINNKYISNVNLLMRFLYYFKNIILNKKKRFQIHSGFVFEDMVSTILKNNSFSITKITRINRKEFDVVTIKNNIIYNFQCKNNLIDLTLVFIGQKKFIRYNKYLVNYYNKALIKEKKRENLLKEKLKIDNIVHYVVTRFPVITDNKKVITFNSLNDFTKEI